MLTKYLIIVKNWVLNMWVVYEAEVIAFLKTVHLEILQYRQLLKTEVPIMFNNFMVTLKKTELWKILNGFVNEIINRYPAVFNILVDFHNKVILTTIAELEKMVNTIMATPTFSFEGLWNILKIEVPAVIANLTKQLLNTDLVKVIVDKLQELRVYFPTIEMAIVDIWAHVIVPVYKDLVILVNKLWTIKFTNVWEVIDLMVFETLNFYKNFVAHLMNCDIAQMIITKVKLFIETNPIIATLYNAVADVCFNIVMALKNDLVTIWNKLMGIPMIKKLVDYILTIFNSKLEPITWKSFITGLHVFVTDILGMTYTLSANHITAVVPLPCTVTTLRNTWASVTTYFSTLIADIVNTWVTVVETITVTLVTVKKYAMVCIEFITEQIPTIEMALKTWVPKFINGFVPTINNFIAFLMNTDVFKFLMAKIDEVIKMYPAEFNAVKAFVVMVKENTIKYVVMVYNKMMEIPVIKKIVDYIWQLINRKDLYSTMVSSVSISVNSFASSMYNTVPAFVTLHTPSILLNWLTSTAQ